MENLVGIAVAYSNVAGGGWVYWTGLQNALASLRGTPSPAPFHIKIRKSRQIQIKMGSQI